MRRFILVFCILLFVCGCAHADIYAVNYSGGAAAVDEQGIAVIPAGEYDRIHILRNDSGVITGYAAGISTEYGIMYAVLDSNGDPLSGHKYIEVISAGEGCIVNEGGVFRYFSSAHKYDDYSFTNMTYAGDGMLLAITGNAYDDIGDTVSILWADGISFRTGIDMLGDFGPISEGLMPLYDAETNLYGYINNQGSWVIKPAYTYAAPFENSLAVVAGDGGYGVIDSTGRIRLATSSLQLTRSGDIFAMIRGGALRVYDSELAITAVMPLNGAQVNLTGEYIIISKADSETVCDVYGTELFTCPAGTQITSAGSGAFIVRSGSWGERCVQLTWLDGSALSMPCNSIYVLDDTRLAYALSDADGTLKYGLMAADGTFVTDALYDSLALVTDGMYCADTDSGAVLLDSEGNILNTFKSGDTSSQN